MLSRLSIQNYAIINVLEVDFSSGLNIITGETGAGKSIIIGALGLILGQRAESGVLLNKERKCVVEGCFKGDEKNKAVKEFLQENELDLHDELTVRREIAPNGKSRAFINDTPVNLSQLNTLSSLLVDLHQQFDTLDIGESDFQREVLDALATSGSILKEYRTVFNDLGKARKTLQQLQEEKSLFEKELDYNQFQFNELEEAGFAPDELEGLDAELKLLTNAEGIRSALSKTSYELEESEEPVLRKLKSLLQSLQSYTALHPLLPQLSDRLSSVHIELQDIADEASRLQDSIQGDAEKLERINERIALGYRLLKKHGVKTTAELLSIKDALGTKLQAVLNIDESINEAQKKSADLFNRADSLASKLSALRKDQVKPLETKVNKMLIQVGMPSARLKVQVTEGALNPFGKDEVEFLFDANKSNNFLPVRKVASGGELSRLMLCIKSLVASSMDLPTLIFDEIDTGISGEAARQVGVIMKGLSSARQVLCITHQPQIAGKAHAHYLVYKSIEKDAVTTGVRILNTDERIVAIAKMLSGEQPTAAALENAREMVMN